MRLKIMEAEAGLLCGNHILESRGRRWEVCLHERKGGSVTRLQTTAFQ